MKTTERRHSPRIALTNLVYVNLVPDNGGILINVSEGGMCFRSAVPVPQSSAAGFSFSMAIHDWIDRHEMQVSVKEDLAPSHVPSHELTSLTAKKRNDQVGRSNDAGVEEPSPSVWQLPKVLTGFSGGLLAGVLISAVVAGLFMLQTHRRDLGATLIRLGERLGGNSVSESTLREPETVSPGLLTPAEKQSPAHAAIPVSRQERAAAKPPATPAQFHEVSVASGTAANSSVGPTANSQPSADAQPAAATHAQASASVKAASPEATSSSPLPRPAVPVVAVASTSEPSADVLRPAVAQVNLAAQPLIRVEQSKPVDAGSPAEKYLEVGKFNKRVWADKTTDRVSQFGYLVSVVQKNGFLKKSYQVLVGPYGSDVEAETAHKTLESHGFTPRSFERGSRDFTMPRALKLDGADLSIGDCTVSWESYLPNAIVKIQMNKGEAVAEGKWVDRNVKYVTDAVVYMQGKDGSRILTEIRFSGMGRAHVFGSSNN